MALSGGDRWLTDHDACQALAQDIMEKITSRNKYPRNSANHAKLSSQARQMMKLFTINLQQLREGLTKASMSYHITRSEVERRQRMVDALASKERQIDLAFSNKGNSLLGEGRTSLLGNELTSKSGPSDLGDIVSTNDMTFEELRQQQQQVIQEQDRGLESLYNVVVRQKNMARGMGEELDLQNEIIDDIADHMDNTNVRLIKETRHVKMVDHKSGTCVYWVIVVLLLIAIVVVAVW